MTQEELRDELAEYGCLHDDGCACMDENYPDACNCKSVDSIMQLINRHVAETIGEDEMTGKKYGTTEDYVRNELRSEQRKRAGL